MTIFYKMTDAEGNTQHGTHWEVGQTVELPEDEQGYEMCHHGLLHVFTDATLGLLLSPDYVDYEWQGPRLFEVEGESVVEASFIKTGGHCFTVVRELPLPAWYTDPVLRHRVRLQVVLLAAKAYQAYFQTLSTSRNTGFSSRDLTLNNTILDSIIASIEVSDNTSLISAIADTAFYTGFLWDIATRRLAHAARVFLEVDLSAQSPKDKRSRNKIMDAVCDLVAILESPSTYHIPQSAGEIVQEAIATIKTSA